MNVGSVDVTFQGRAEYTVAAGSTGVVALNLSKAFLHPDKNVVQVTWLGYAAYEYSAQNYLQFRFNGEVTAVARALASSGFMDEVFSDGATLSLPLYRVAGVVKDLYGVPCARAVRAYDTATGALLGSVTSGASDGAFEISGFSFVPSVYVMAFDPAENAVVADHVVPVR